MNAYHDSRKTEYRSPFGAAPAGGEITLALDVTGAPEELRCDLMLSEDGGAPRALPMERGETSGGARFTLRFHAPGAGALLWYHFALTSGDGTTLGYGCPPAGGGEGELTGETPRAYQITVYEPRPAPGWFRNTIAYQIFPDRFFRGKDWRERRENARRPESWKGPARIFQEDWRDTPFYTRNERGEVTRWPFFGGTLEGVREKLLYLKSLGVGTIYLNPIFAAASNHRYDTADYLAVDPGLGDEKSFAALVKDAGNLGVRLILDGVFAHTGADSVYFNRYGNYPGPGACQGEESPYHPWYRFTGFPDHYESWWGVDDLPKTVKENPDYQAFIYGKADSVVRRWLRAGASGWRLDVADELPDAFIAGIRAAMEAEDPEAVLLGEVWEDASNKISYGSRRQFLLGRQLHSVMNYPLRAWALDWLRGSLAAGALAERLLTLAEHYPPDALAMALNLIGSHDRARALTVLGDAPEDLTEVRKEAYVLPPEKYGLAVRHLKLLSLLQFSLPGVPCVYYGDEAGLQGFEDPYNRGTFPWGREEEEITAHYRFLALLRRQFPVLVSGELSVEGLTDHVCLVRRRDADGEVAVVLNRGIFEHERVVLPTDAGYALELFSSRESHPAGGGLEVVLEPVSAQAFRLLKRPPEETVLPRAAGVLCALRSVPAAGARPTEAEAFRFVDFLAGSGQKLWQLLPLNPPGLGNSPFYSRSLFALGETLEPEEEEAVDEGAFRAFCAENAGWLPDHALFTALLEQNGGAPWQQWPEKERDRRDLPALFRTHAAAVLAEERRQFLREKRWLRVKEYAGGRGVSVVGDLPICPAPDSADVWANRELFYLEGTGAPSLRAGVPPDYFNAEGQNWGNPLYRWETALPGLTDWWEARLRRALRCCDYARIDHFRAFAAFFAIPAGGVPKEGYWLPGPGPDFFRALRDRLGSLPVIAEDLGVLDAGVHNLRRLSGLPGMKVWQFCAGEMEAMPPAEAARCVFYSGTHDNQTLTGWCALDHACRDPAARADSIAAQLYAVSAPWVILPLQDLLLLPDSARMNTPGTPEGNWNWRAEQGSLTRELAEKLAERVRESRR